MMMMPGGLGSWRKGRNYPNDSIAKKGQNPETSPGDLRKLAVTQKSSEKSSANTDVKNSKGVNNNNNNNNVTEELLKGLEEKKIWGLADPIQTITLLR